MFDTLMIYSNMKYKGEVLSVHMSTEEKEYGEWITLSTYNGWWELFTKKVHLPVQYILVSTLVL